MTDGTKITLVTGAGSGLGRSVAIGFLKAGYACVLAGRRLEALEETITKADDGASRALPVSTDVSDPGSVEYLFSEIAARFGRLDVIFNNAGNNVPPTSIGDLTFEQWKTVIDVNLNGAFLCASAAYRMMRDQTPQGGRIINNGSISAHVPRPGSAPYTSSKHAITGLTRSISLDGRAHNIACGQIDIGNAASPMTKAMQAGVPQADGSIAPEPVMDADHVATSVVYMAGLPLDANVQFMTVMATKMPFIGRG